MPMLLDVITVRPRPDFQLDLEFKNGEHRRFKGKEKGDVLDIFSF
jgi:hypothetical protein